MVGLAKLDNKMSSGNDLFDELLTGMNLEPGVSEQQLINVEKQLGTILPEEYKQLLRFSNGAAGMVGAQEVHLFSLEEAIVANSQFRSSRRELFIFGSNGGAEAYAFDPPNKFTVVMVPFSAMGTSEAIVLGTTLIDFLNNLKGNAR